MELHEALTYYRKRAGMRIADVAAKSGMPLSTLAKIFSGSVTDPTYASVQKIANAIGVSTAELAWVQQQSSVGHSLSADAMHFALMYDTLDVPGRRIVELVLKEETARIEEYGPLRKAETSGKPMSDEEAIALASERYGSVGVSDDRQAESV